MKNILYLIILISIFSCTKEDNKLTSSKRNEVVTPPPNHIIVVLEENEGYDKIIGNKDAAFINSLADSGELFTNFHAITHPSQPNYLALFSGSTQGIKDDQCVDNKFNTPNLYDELKAIGKTCAWYSENLPATGSTVCRGNLYARKHNPLSDFKSIPDSENKMFSQFPTNYSNLENLVFITPNVRDDMHSGTIKQADDWLKNNLSRLKNWCKKHNGVFIITCDEDEGTKENLIPVIMYGEGISVSKNSDYYTHYDMTKTLCAMMGADTEWTNNVKTSKVIQY